MARGYRGTFITGKNQASSLYAWLKKGWHAGRGTVGPGKKTLGCGAVGEYRAAIQRKDVCVCRCAAGVVGRGRQRLGCRLCWIQTCEGFWTEGGEGGTKGFWRGLNMQQVDWDVVPVRSGRRCGVRPTEHELLPSKKKVLDPFPLSVRLLQVTGTLLRRVSSRRGWRRGVVV
jgi:hypothetical protein